MLSSEHIYTHAGWQRPVYMQPGVARVRFAAEGSGQVQVSYDDPGLLRRGQGVWLDFPEAAGSEVGISALRVRVVGEDGILRVVQEKEI